MKSSKVSLIFHERKSSKARSRNDVNCRSRSNNELGFPQASVLPNMIIVLPLADVAVDNGTGIRNLETVPDPHPRMPELARDFHPSPCG